MLIADDITLPINWHELRILTIWASNYAEGLRGDNHRKTLHSLIKRLERYRPVGGAALTLIGEIKELQQDYPETELYDSEGNLIIPPKTDE